MPKEKSAGAIIYRKESVDTAQGKKYKIYFLLLHYFSGHWEFPKGHIEKDETEEETLKRETFEIPFPFNIKKEQNKLVFDYTLESLAEQDYELLVNLKATNQVKKCKFFNSILTISSLN